jgi:hypothetical protein
VWGIADENKSAIGRLIERVAFFFTFFVTIYAREGVCAVSACGSYRSLFEVRFGIA